MKTIDTVVSKLAEQIDRLVADRDEWRNKCNVMEMQHKIKIELLREHSSKIFGDLFNILYVMDKQPDGSILITKENLDELKKKY